jgi:hypothetical protein
MDNNNGINYVRNDKELVWYQEYIYQEGSLIGEIFTAIDGDGYNLRKLVPVSIQNGTVEIMQTVGNFTSVCDAKSFVNQAGGL